jgi:hypothetical protein
MFVAATVVTLHSFGLGVLILFPFVIIRQECFNLRHRRRFICFGALLLVRTEMISFLLGAAGLVLCQGKVTQLLKDGLKDGINLY